MSVAGEELLALIFEEVHRGRGLYKPSAAARRPAVKWHNARRMALPKGQLCHLRRLRHADRLGERASSTPSRRRRRATASRSRTAGGHHPAVPRDLARDRERLLRALRRGAAPRRRSRSPRRSAGRSSPRAPASCPTRSQRWAPFKETNPQLKKFAKKFQTGLISNIDDKLLGQTRRHIAARLRPRRHRPAGALLQARPGALQGVRAPHRRQEGLGPHRGQLLPRRRAVPEGEGPRDLGQPQQGGARAGQKKPTAEVKTLLEAAKLLGAA